MFIEISNKKISFKALADLIDRKEDLRVIRLENVVLEGCEDDEFTLSRVLRGHPSLQEICMMNVRAAEKEMTLDQMISMVLVSVNGIKTVKLSHVKVRSSTLLAASYSSTLKRLLLPNCGLGEILTAEVFREISAKVGSLEEIDISNNGFSKRKCLEIHSALKNSKSLKQVNFQGNDKKERVFKNRCVEFRNETIEFSEVSAILNKNQDLKLLQFQNIVLLGDSDEEYSLSRVLRGHPSLEEFIMINVAVAEPDVSLDPMISMLFVSAPRLETVKLSHVEISSSTLSTAVFSATLKKLLLSDCSLNDADAFAVSMVLAAGNTSIEEVDLSNNNLSNKACSMISAALEKNGAIKRIRLEGNGKMSKSLKNKIAGKLMNRRGMMPHAA